MEMVNKQDHSHTFSFFPDPWLHPTPWDVYIQDHYRVTELVNQILRKRPEVPIGCFLSNGQLGRTQCLNMRQSSSYTCQKHFEDIYRAIQIAKNLPDINQRKQIRDFCLNYLRPCVHEMKNIVTVAIYLKLPQDGRNPDMEEVKEASRLLAEYENEKKKIEKAKKKHR